MDILPIFPVQFVFIGCVYLLFRTWCRRNRCLVSVPDMTSNMCVIHRHKPFNNIPDSRKLKYPFPQILHCFSFSGFRSVAGQCVSIEFMLKSTASLSLRRYSYTLKSISKSWFSIPQWVYWMKQCYGMTAYKEVSSLERKFWHRNKVEKGIVIQPALCNYFFQLFILM